mgnify:CR=1 FL=1
MERKDRILIREPLMYLYTIEYKGKTLSSFEEIKEFDLDSFIEKDPCADISVNPIYPLDYSCSDKLDISTLFDLVKDKLPEWKIKYKNIYYSYEKLDYDYSYRPFICGYRYETDKEYDDRIKKVTDFKNKMKLKREKDKEKREKDKIKKELETLNKLKMKYGE